METVKEVKIINPTIGKYATKKIRVAAYCRVSTDSEDQYNSFIAQVKYYNDFIRTSKDLTLVDIYADEGITGTSVSKRDDFKRMIKDCKAGKIDRVYVKSVSRFARNSLECIEYIRILKECNVAVLFENDGIDTEKMNSEMILYIKGAFAQSESLSNSKRVSTAIRMRMENGNFVTTTAPYGYKLENGKLIVIPEEAEIVRRIFNDYLAGKGQSLIITELNEENVGNRKWTREAIRYILANEKYVGDSLWQKTYTPQMLPLRNVRNDGAVDKYYVENTHEAIIDKAKFDLAQKLKAKSVEGRENYTRHQLALSKTVRCGECGWLYKTRVQNGIRYWVCTQNGVGGFRCGGKILRDDQIKKLFVSFYNRLKQNETEIIDWSINQLMSLKSKVAQCNSQISEIDEEMAELSEQNNTYAQLRADGILDDVTYFEETNELHKRITELRSRRIKLLNEDEDENCIEQLRKAKETLSECPTVLFDFDIVIFKKLIHEIKVYANDTVEFELHCGLRLKEKI